MCLDEVVVSSCEFTASIQGAKSGQEQQAQKMVSVSNSKLAAVDIGTNVVVRGPDLDRGRLAQPHEMS
jgi:hypothetical protein